MAGRARAGLDKARLADGSKVTCRPILQTQHSANDVLCNMLNVAVNYAPLSGMTFPSVGSFWGRGLGVGG